MSPTEALTQHAADRDATSWLTIPRATRLLSADVSEAMVRRAIAKGELPSEQFYGRRLVHLDALRAWAGSRYVGAR